MTVTSVKPQNFVDRQKTEQDKKTAFKNDVDSAKKSLSTTPPSPSGTSSQAQPKPNAPASTTPGPTRKAAAPAATGTASPAAATSAQPATNLATDPARKPSVADKARVAEAGKEAETAYQKAASDPGQRDLLTKALTGKSASELDDSQRAKVDQFLDDVRDGKGPKVTFRAAANSNEVDPAAAVAKGGKDLLPGSVQGAYVDGKSGGTALISNRLDDAGRTSAAREEYGEALAAEAEKRGIVTSKGDDGDRLAQALDGKDTSKAAAPEMHRDSPSDKTTVMLDGKPVEAVAKAKTVKTLVRVDVHVQYKSPDNTQVQYRDASPGSKDRLSDWKPVGWVKPNQSKSIPAKEVGKGNYPELRLVNGTTGQEFKIPTDKSTANAIVKTSPHGTKTIYVEDRPNSGTPGGDVVIVMKPVYKVTAVKPKTAPFSGKTTKTGMGNQKLPASGQHAHHQAAASTAQPQSAVAEIPVSKQIAKMPGPVKKMAMVADHTLRSIQDKGSYPNLGRKSKPGEGAVGVQVQFVYNGQQYSIAGKYNVAGLDTAAFAKTMQIHIANGLKKDPKFYKGMKQTVVVSAYTVKKVDLKKVAVKNGQCGANIAGGITKCGKNASGATVGTGVVCGAAVTGLGVGAGIVCGAAAAGAAVAVGSVCGARLLGAGACFGRACGAAATMVVACAAAACGSHIVVGAGSCAGNACGAAAKVGFGMSPAVLSTCGARAVIANASAGEICGSQAAVASACTGNACGSNASAAHACASNACAAQASIMGACAANLCAANLNIGPDWGPCIVNFIPFIPFI